MIHNQMDRMVIMDVFHVWSIPSTYTDVKGYGTPVQEPQIRNGALIPRVNDGGFPAPVR